MTLYQSSIHDGVYGPEEVLASIFRGDNEESARETLAQLAALGEGHEGDRLRCLFMLVVRFMQTRTYEHGGALRWSSGRPMTPLEIAREVLWDENRIEADLAKLRGVGLMDATRIRALPAQGMN